MANRVMAIWRFNDGIQELPNLTNLPAPLWAVKFLIGRKINSRSNAQGIGAHSRQEQYDIAARDIKNVSKILGAKEFILGDRPCENDAAIFGMLSQFYWGTPNSPFHKLVEGT